MSEKLRQNEPENEPIQQDNVHQDTPKKHFLEVYHIHDKPEAKRAGEKKWLREGKKGYPNRSEVIEAYLDRLEHVFLHHDPSTRERNLNLLKNVIYDNTIIKEENFPETYFGYQKMLAKNQGIEIPDFTKEQKSAEIKKVQETQKRSLDAWINYLGSDDCKYPTDLKFFAMKGVLEMGDFDTEKYSFSKRTKKTTNPFPEIDREALSDVLGALEVFHHQKSTNSCSSALLELIKNNVSFEKMYALRMKELDKATGEKPLHITSGTWRTFTNATELVASLEGQRSNLCIANIGSAKRYLLQGPIHVYFSNDLEGNSTIPRVAVATRYNESGKETPYEIRGTLNKNEDIDSYISETPIIKEHLTIMEGGEEFLKKDQDMKRLTKIYQKCFKVDRKTNTTTYLNPELSKDELKFIYEIDRKIQGFGYKQDNRIEEIIIQRDKRNDIATAIDCKLEEVSLNKTEALMDNIKFHYGDLDLPSLTSAEGLKLPETLGGDLDLPSLTSAEGLKLPETIGGSLYLPSLTSAEGLKLPETIGGGLDLSSLTSAERLKLKKKYPHLIQKLFLN